jgi:hypothetical protein
MASGIRVDILQKKGRRQRAEGVRIFMARFVPKTAVIG